MEKKFILLINDNRVGSICYRGEGTVAQIKNDIEGLIRKGIKPGNLEVIPVSGTRADLLKNIVLGTTLIMLGWYFYENIHKRARKRRGKYTNS